MTEWINHRPRGRPPKTPRTYPDTREALLQAGVAALTEYGFTHTGLDRLLRDAGVPKGSFYHYFPSKEAFGREVVSRYAQYFADKLDFWLRDEQKPPLERLAGFVDSAKAGMSRYQFQRGCLVGNLGQEITQLPEEYRRLLEDIFQDWQQRLARCLQQAQTEGHLDAQLDCHQLAEYFWIGWEGAVMRARLTQSTQPLDVFFQVFMTSLSR